jgi:hypothetical protein
MRHSGEATFTRVARPLEGCTCGSAPGTPFRVPQADPRRSPTAIRAHLWFWNGCAEGHGATASVRLGPFADGTES